MRQSSKLLRIQNIKMKRKGAKSGGAGKTGKNGGKGLITQIIRQKGARDWGKNHSHKTGRHLPWSNPTQVKPAGAPHTFSGVGWHPGIDTKGRETVAAGGQGKNLLKKKNEALELRGVGPSNPQITCKTKEGKETEG